MPLDPGPARAQKIGLAIIIAILVGLFVLGHVIFGVLGAFLFLCIGMIVLLILVTRN